MTNIAIERKFCLINELETSVGFLKKGMGELQKINQKDGFSEAPIFLLSFGLEKFLKCLIVIAYWDDTEKLIRTHKIWKKRNGHKLENLMNTVIRIVEENKDYLSRPVAREDIAFITENSSLNDFIAVLSKFSQGGRYYNLNIIMVGTSDFSNPINGWKEIENEIFSRREDLQIKLFDDLTFDHSKELIHEIVVIMERFLRALSRFFTLAEIGPMGKQMSPIVYDFLMLMDSEIGKRDYNDFQRHPQ